MKSISKRLLVLSVVLVVVAVAYAWWMNIPPLQGNRNAGLPREHMRLIGAQSDHIDLLFSQHGGAYFNFSGEQVSVFIAHFQRDEPVLHELITSIENSGTWGGGGSMSWGLTTEGGNPGEIRVLLALDGGTVSSTFDFSRLDFEPWLISGPEMADGRIEPGRRYALQVWQTGNTVRVVGSEPAFDPEQLRMSEHTAILYIVFN